MPNSQEKHKYDSLLDGGIFLILVCLPLYLIRFKIDWIPISLLEILIYTVFALWFLKKILAQNNKEIFSPYFKIWVFPLLVLWLAVTVSAYFSENVSVSAGIWKAWFVAPMLFFLVLIDQVKTTDQVKEIIKATFLSAVVVSLVALLYWRNDYLTFDGRLQGFYLSPNHLAMYLAPILVLSFGLYWLSAKKALVFVFLGQLLILAAIYLTYSYGTWLSLACAFLFVSIYKFRDSKLSKIFLAFLAILIIFTLWQVPTQKFQDIFFSSRSSLQSRIMVWQSAYLILKDNLYLGIGPGMFQEYYLKYQKYFEPYLEWAMPQPHNIFLAFWLQTGLLGLVAFLWLLIVYFKELFKYPHFLATVLMAAMIYTLVHGLIDSTYWKNDLAVIFWLLVGLAAVNKNIIKKRPDGTLIKKEYPA